MEYQGEHLLIGNIGNLFVIMAFVSALLASISYYFAAKNNEESLSWQAIARKAFLLHAVSVMGIVVTLFIMLANHYFEYEYVWHHSNKEMPMRYILSCFWEGQEGSFLLWLFWHVVLGIILLRTSKTWEAPVMAVISMVQFFLASMLLGIFVFEYRIGSNPFTVLLREHPEFSNAPLFSKPDYLERLDGRGLNPLLQNYWMTIHPPVLFLGFAATVVPFAYAIAGLWQKRFTEWIKPALPWVFFGVMILGTGILMGGAWAYEALSFGGFWAWDPVENASLVPWLVLVGAAHLMLVNKNKAQSLYATFFLTALAFILILYSTFLTRSGILGETSVHAFTDLGMSGQLLIYLLFFVLLSVYLIVKNVRYIPTLDKEEDLWSREFWMFVGSIVLLVSSFQIIFYTSMPVWNKLFSLNKAPVKDVVTFYNTWQLPFAIVVSLLIALGQYFKYKKTNLAEFRKKIFYSFIFSIAITLIACYQLNYFREPFYALLLFANVFAVTANADYIRQVLNGKIKKAGASIAHIGFALMMIGVLISTSKKQIISQNTSGKSIESLGESFSNNNNILLTQGDTLPMGNYYVTYKGKRFEGVNIYFDVDYFTKNDKGEYAKEFQLSPLVQTNPRMGNVAEPDTRHFITYDVYTHVTYAVQDALKKEGNSDEYTSPKEHMMKQGDTISSSNAIVILDSISTRFDRTPHHIDNGGDLAVMAYLRVMDANFKTYHAHPIYYLNKNVPYNKEDEVKELGLRFYFSEIDPQQGAMKILVQEKKSNVKDFIVMQAMIFPYINILWIGCLVMVVGTVLAILERIRKKTNLQDEQS